MILRRALIAGLCWLPWSAWAVSPTIDGTSVNTDSGNVPGAHADISAILTTSSSPDIIVCSVVVASATLGSPNNLTGCAASGLTFVLRKRYSNDMDSNCNVPSPCNVNVEIWEAVASATLSAKTITATYTTPLCLAPNFCGSAIVVFGVNGVASTTAPHDPSVSLPVTSFSSGDAHVTSGSVITSNPDDLLLWYFGGGSQGQAACAGNQSSPEFPWLLVNDAAFPSTFCMHVAQLSVSGLVNTAYVSPNVQHSWDVIVDAFTSNAPPPPTPNPPRRPFAHGWPW